MCALAWYPLRSCECHHRYLLVLMGMPYLKIHQTNLEKSNQLWKSSNNDQNQLHKSRACSITFSPDSDHEVVLRKGKMCTTKHPISNIVSFTCVSTIYSTFLPHPWYQFSLNTEAYKILNGKELWIRGRLFCIRITWDLATLPPREHVIGLFVK